MKTKSIILLSSALLLVSCGGGQSSSDSTGESKASDTSATTSEGSSGTQSSSASSKEEAFGWSVDKTSHSFPKQIGWDYDGVLPVLESGLVAFCPKDAKYTGVYTWDDAGHNPHGGWPGTTMTTVSEYDQDWYQINIPDYNALNIIFNGSGQTKDMTMTHPGYWWFWTSDKDVHDTEPQASWIDVAKFTSDKTINVVANVKFTEVVLYEGDDVLIRAENPDANAINFNFGDHEVDLAKGYHIEATLEGGKEKEAEVDFHYLFNLPSFDEKYAYNGNDLGATYTRNSTTFKVWSPFSSSIKLRLYENGTPVSVDATKGSDTVYKEVAMTLGEKGVYSATVNEDLDGKYYTYVVTNSTYTNFEVVDPYAKAVGANGRRGEVLDFSKTNPVGWDQITPHQIDRKALTVWECHIADLTSSETWTGTEANRLRYAGFHESGTTYTADEVTVKTGFDHVKEMGVNAVQILPMFDQDNDELHPSFNWGYNPLNYNAPEGVYSSNPHDGAVRIAELKALIADYHNAGINIIMDVVYNHVAGANKSNFDVLMPGYYYRYTNSGVLSNGSGCGNETASEHAMMRKFIVDSTRFWADEYKLGGFRFDLMALHDLDTMKEVAAETAKINPGIVIYGEPWTGGTTTLDSSKMASQANGNKYVGYGQFNDGMRDALIKGGMNSYSTTGWATETSSKKSSELNVIVEGIKGTTDSAGKIQDPDKTVNYVACHDNFTIYDRCWVLIDGNTPARENTRRKMAMLAESVVFTSQGTAFMLAGDEFLRTKPDTGNDSTKGKSHNSYDKSYKTNELDYALKIKNADIVENMQQLIALKVNASGLHLGKDAASRMEIKTSNDSQIVYDLHDESTGFSFRVAHCNGLGAGDPIDFSGYTLYLDTLHTDKALSSSYQMDKFQTVIAYKQ